ncbi:MAG: hypothetical protein LQ343_003976 [Gyalolechia ehrenbergii]|nr:MAG: hypothetical protein LQ343_003976 [Gyalolechia ehrenbergii]
MALSGTISLIKSQTNSADGFDHAIKLVDTTKPKNDKSQHLLGDLPESSGASLSRKWTRDTLRKELAKRKYAKWQGGDDQLQEGSRQTSTDINQHIEEEEEEAQAYPTNASSGDDPTSQKIQKQQEAKTKKDHKRSDHSQNPESFIDVLYENQRGWFLFGMPLYSANSLLNFDPAPWQNSTFKDSPVNITNAQVPDPSWQWAWKTWYVDMSHDVDEEGWEYSFSFQSRFAWHGSHPWFHSFARRRRWLRKRIKVHPSRLSGGRGTMKGSHQLNADYFTIHGAKRDRSPDSSAEGTLANRSSYVGYDGQESDSDQDFNDVTNVIALLAVLKKASVDREKIAAVRTFLAQGADELHYLADNMDEIMGLLIYQTSRQQLFDYLVQALKEAEDSQASDTKSEESDRESVDRRINSMTRAVDASRAYLSGSDYWTDATERERLGKSSHTVAPAVGEDSTDWPEETRSHIQEANTDNQIRGIPKEADVDTAPSPLRTAHEQAEGSAGGSMDKGKGKEQG